MSKEEFLKIQTCVLKVNLHCDGCKNKVKKILQKIEGVYTVKIDSEQGKVTVSGNVDPHSLIKKLTKNGKHAEIWGAPKPNNNNLNNQFKNMQIDHGKGGNNNNKGQGGQKGGGGGGHNQPKGGGGGGPPGQNGQNPHVQQQLQQLQQMKGFQDLKMPPQLMKDMKMPFAGNKGGQNPKAVKFNVPEDEGFSDEFDDDDDYDDDDEFDDDFDEAPLDKMKPMMGKGHGGGGGPQMMPNMMNMMMKGPGGGGNGGNNGGGSGGGSIPVQMNIGGPNVGKKGDNGNNKGGNQNQASGKGGKNGGGQPQDGKKGGGGGNGGGGQNKNGGGGGHQNNFNAHGAKKGGGMNDGPHGMPNMMAMNGGRPMGHMGNPPMGQMSNLAAVQGLPASSMNGGGGGGSGGPGPGYFQGGRPEAMAGNPYFQQQQLAAAMMNQQQANGNERFQPMMYARPPPAVNYMPPYPPYPYPPPPGCRADQYSMFSDENTESCTVM